MSKMEEDIKWLINDSGLTITEIFRKTGVTPQMLGRYKEGGSSLTNMRLNNALSLSTYAKKLREEVSA